MTSLRVFVTFTLLFSFFSPLLGQSLIAGWDFQTTATGGTQVLASPNTQMSFVANFGLGNLYLNGTNGASTWLQASELNGFGGSALNATGGFSTVTTGISCLSLVSNTANNKKMVLSFNMTGYQNLVVSYDIRGTATGFSAQLWEYSTNGSTWTAIQTVTGTNVPTFFTQTLSTITALNNVSTAYLRLTVSGATSTMGNNRIDNIRLDATAISAVPPVITSALSKTSLQGLAISPYTITASNAPTVFHATGLPAGLSIDTLSGQITGIPTTLGTYNVNISATNAFGTGSAILIYTINPQIPVITNALSATGTVGIAFNFTLTATNSPDDFAALNLPSGLSLDTVSGIISGIPTSIGTYSVPIAASNITGTANATLVITINPPAPVITSVLTASGTEGTAISNYTIMATNSPTSYGASPLPAGLVVDTNTGIISGTPTVNGTFNVTITATNAGGMGSAILVFTILPPASPTITLNFSGFIMGGNFGTQCINTSSSVSSYQVSGSDLTNNIQITAPSGFEISLSNSPFSPNNPITLTQTLGNVGLTTIYVRYSPTIVGPSGGLQIGHVSIGAANQNITVSGICDDTAPSISLGTVSNLDTTSLDINGTSFIQNCFTVLSSGICYALSPLPTIANDTLNNFTNSSPFNTHFVGLSPNTKYYYRAYLTYINGGNQIVYSAQDSFTTLKVEPDTFPSAFACGNPTATSMDLTWVDANSPQVPDAYLIKWSSVSFAAIADPIDGLVEVNGAGVQNVAQGIQNYTATGLMPVSTYYFKIWSYTNSGTGINYKLLNEPQSTCTTLSYQQSGTATYTFSGGTANAASAPISNLTLSPVSHGNNNGITTLITNTSASTGYTGATGTFNAGVAARIGALNTNANNSAYFEFSLSPDNGFTVALTAISFGSRSTSTGPQAFAIRTNLDNYSSNVVTGTLLNNSVWALANPTIPTLLSPLSTSLIVRIYGYNGTGSPALNTANWRIDDINLTVEVASTRILSTDTLSDLSFCEGETFNVPYLVNIPFLTGNSFYAQLSDSTGAWTTPIQIGTITATTSGNITATLPLGTIGTGYRVRVVSDMPNAIGSDNAQDIAIYAIPANPGIISVTPYCGSANLTTLGNAMGVYTWYDNATAIGSILGTGNILHVTDTGYYYVFDIANGCYSNPTNIYINNIHPTPTNIPSTNGTTYIATGECNDVFGWTNYYDGANHLLLSIQKNGVITGTIGDGVFGVKIDGNAGAPAASGAVLIPQNYPNNYVQSPNWYTMNRYWSVTPNGLGAGGQIDGDVNVRFYFKDADVQAIMANVPSILSVSDLHFYKINGVYNPNPNPNSNHANIPEATAYNSNGYWQYTNGVGSTTATWSHGIPSFGNHYAAFTVGQFSGGGGGGSNNFGAFPIVLFSFTGKNMEGKNVLEWVTASEENADRFEVYRAGDNQIFEKIGELSALGYGAKYAFIDKTPLKDLNYYKLKVISNDGTHFYSNIVSIHAEEGFNYAIYPNPANDKLFVSMMGTNNTGRFRIYDGQGNKLYEMDIDNDVNYSLDIAALPSGVYLYQFYTSGEVHTGKLVIVK